MITKPVLQKVGHQIFFTGRLTKNWLIKDRIQVHVVNERGELIEKKWKDAEWEEEHLSLTPEWYLNNRERCFNKYIWINFNSYEVFAYDDFIRGTCDGYYIYPDRVAFEKTAYFLFGNNYWFTRDRSFWTDNTLANVLKDGFREICLRYGGNSMVMHGKVTWDRLMSLTKKEVEDMPDCWQKEDNVKQLIRCFGQNWWETIEENKIDFTLKRILNECEQQRPVQASYRAYE